MAQLSEPQAAAAILRAGKPTAAADCCESSAMASCCAPEAKHDCCGTETAPTGASPGRCGCDAGKAA